MTQRLLLLSTQCWRLGSWIEIVRVVYQSPILILCTAVLFNHSNKGQRLQPFLESIASRIRLQRSVLTDLAPLSCDSDFIHIEGKLDGDQLFISNELHCARGLRKIHIESARLGGYMEILHCVFFPNPNFNIPIFGVDVVSTNSRISAAIVDLSPVSNDLPLPINKQLSTMSLPTFKKVRKLPEWGSIFSKHVCFVSPEGANEK